MRNKFQVYSGALDEWISVICEVTSSVFQQVVEVN